MLLGTAVVVSGVLAACAGQVPAAPPAAEEPTPAPVVAAAVAAATTTAATVASEAGSATTTKGYLKPMDRGSGDPAPDFELTSLKGEPLVLSAMRGKIVVLNFWASWCAPCRFEMPFFEKMSQEWLDKDIVFIGVSVFDEEEKAREFADKVGVTYPLGIDITGQVARDFRVTGLPTTYIIDRDGNEARKVGYANEAVLRIIFKGLLGDG